MRHSAWVSWGLGQVVSSKSNSWQLLIWQVQLYNKSVKKRNIIEIYKYRQETEANPYSGPVVNQWQSSGDPVSLDPRPQYTLECHWRKNRG